MNIADGKTSALFKERAENFAVYGFTGKIFIAFTQQFRFQRIVSTQGGITTADKEIILMQLFCHRIHSLSDLFVDKCGFFLSQTTGVGQNIKQRLCPLESLQNRSSVPVGKNRDIMYGLDPCGIVIQYYKLPVIFRNLFLKQKVDGCFIYNG